jgi:hypothetical protein
MSRPRLAGMLCLCVATTAARPALAQRVEAKTTWQKHDVVIEYGPVRVGKHTLGDFAPGTQWRMGNNTASVFRTESPLLSGDAILLPGSYRVSISRREGDVFTLDSIGGSFGLGGVNDTVFHGTLSEAKANDKLALEWQPDPSAKDAGPNKAMAVRVQFGPSVLTVPMLLLGGRSAEVPGFGVEFFSAPVDVFERRSEADRLTPIASFAAKGSRDKKTPAAFNLLLGKTAARLQPQGVAPTDSYGFGEVQLPDAAFTRKGTVKWSDAPESSKPAEVLSLDKLERTKDKHLHLIVACGKHIADVDVADPLLTDAAASAKTGSSH